MSKLSSVVDVVISRERLTISSEGFGTTLLLVESTALDSRVQRFASTAEMIADNQFGVACIPYLAAAQHTSQAFKPAQFKIGMKGRANRNCMQRVLFDAAMTAGTFILTVNGEATAPIAFDASNTEIKAALELLNCITTATVTVNVAETDYTIELNTNEAFSKIVVDHSAAIGPTTYTTMYGHQFTWPAAVVAPNTVTITVEVNGVSQTTAAITGPLTAANVLAAVLALSNVGSGNMTILEEVSSQTYTLIPTADLYGATISVTATESSQGAATIDEWWQGQADETWKTAITACEAEDADFLIFTTPELHSNSHYTSQCGLADYAEAGEYKIYGAKSSDPLSLGTYNAASPADIGAYTAANSYDRTFCIYQNPTKAATQFPATAITGRQLALIPGSSTWKFKELVGCTIEKLTSSQKSNLDDRNMNVYGIYGAEKSFMEGTVASGEFIDIIVGIDYMKSGIAQYVFIKMKAAEKIPITDDGGAVLESLTRAGLKFYGVDSDLIDESTIVITVIPRAELNPLDIAARSYKGIKFSAQLKGAIHKAIIDGYLYI